MYPFPSLSGLESFFAGHGLRTGREFFRMHEAPWTQISLRVERKTIRWIVVLGNSLLYIRRLTNVDLSGGCRPEYVDEVSHLSKQEWLLR